jgi:hypothetical protein
MTRIRQRDIRLLRHPSKLFGRLTGPKVLVVSIPQSGTNMLRHTLNQPANSRSWLTRVQLLFCRWNFSLNAWLR